MISWTSIVSGCHPPIPWWKSGFSGRVLDMETGIPIADAAVVAIWCADHFRMDGGPALLWVEDTVTDQKGRFRLWPRPAIVWNPFYWPMPPVLVAFRPGYRECRRGAERDNPDCRPPTIRLRKLDLVERAHADADLSGVREDVLFSSDKPSSGSCLFLPASRIPRLAILVQAEEALYGRKYSGEPLTEQESAHLWRLVLDRGADDQPPALPSPTTIAGMKSRSGTLPPSNSVLPIRYQTERRSVCSAIASQSFGSARNRNSSSRSRSMAASRLAPTWRFGIETGRPDTSEWHPRQLHRTRGGVGPVRQRGVRSLRNGPGTALVHCDSR